MSTGSEIEHSSLSSNHDEPPPQQHTQTTQDLSQQVLTLVKNADIKTLQFIIGQCQDLINKHKSTHVSRENLCSQFRVLPSILTSCSEMVHTTNDSGSLLLSPGTIGTNSTKLMDNLKQEVESLGLRDKSGTPRNRKVASQWLIKDPQKTNLPSVDIDNYPHINKLRSIVSNLCSPPQDFNSCIVNYYCDGSARTRPHSDDASYEDQSSPIANFSIGDSRHLGIFDKNDGQMITKFELVDGSLFIMDPGAQSNTKHQVLPNRNGPGKERFSISFRTIKYTEVINEWPLTNRSTNLSVPPAKNAVSGCKTTLILGTSIPYFLDYKKLSGATGKTRVVNLCKRGAKINHLHDVLDEHFKSECANEDVDKIILSVGTNDIRNNQKSSVGHLYSPMENLIAKIKTYYPGAIIYIQCLLPQRVTNAYTVSNVQGFNRLLFKLCALNQCFYLDIFEDFLDRNNHPNPTLYRQDGVHLSAKGLSMLARAFISKIRGRFNPITRP